MTVSSESYWPESGPDQDVFLANLQRRLDNLRHAIKPVVVPKFFEPSQADWEQAWSLATGLFPPIPPGVKLLWYDLSAGEMREYTVTYNLGNGTDSDGTVFPAHPGTDDASYFRFLGSLSRRGTMLSAFAKPDSTITTLMVNPDIWMRRGLLRIIIEFALDVTTAAMELRCGLPRTKASGDYQLSDYANPRFDVTALRATRAGGTSLSVTIDPNTAPEFSGGYLTETITVSPSMYPFVGRIEIDLGATKDDEKQYFGPLISLLGASFGAAASASDIELHYGMLARSVASNPLRHQVYLSEFSPISPAPGDAPYPVQGQSTDRAWIYGLFDTQQESELGEF